MVLVRIMYEESYGIIFSKLDKHKKKSFFEFQTIK